MGICDVCNRTLSEEEGYLLTTEQVVSCPGYWRKALSGPMAHMAAAFGHSDDSFKAGLASQMAAQATPWMVCEECISLFAVDRNEARGYALRWYKSGGQFSPPGSGPVPLSKVRMGDGKVYIQGGSPEALEMAGRLRAAPSQREDSPSPAGPAQVPEPTHSFWWRWLNVYISPGEAFRDIARKPEFIFPLIVAVVGALAVTETMLGKIGMDRIIRNAIEQSGRASSMTAEQMEQAVRGGATFGTIAAHLGAVLGPVIFVVVVAALGLAFVNGILGAKLDFKTSLSVTAYSILPGAISGLMTIAVILFGDVERFNPNNPSPTNLGFFLNPLETSKPIMALASSLDVFSVWTLALLGIGYSEAAGRKVKALTVSMIYLGALLVWVLGKVGLAVLT